MNPAIFCSPAEPCSNPAKDCTKNNLLIIIDFKKEKGKKFKLAGIGNNKIKINALKLVLSVKFCHAKFYNYFK